MACQVVACPRNLIRPITTAGLTNPVTYVAVSNGLQCVNEAVDLCSGSLTVFQQLPLVVSSVHSPAFLAQSSPSSACEAREEGGAEMAAAAR